ncbi:MAG: folate family ECF transporter S component [Oscillospiraceae bacterium]|nr:folate family ECF transporter S component [Oscillospiraceae bacterium]
MKNNSKFDVGKITRIALLIAIEIVLSRFLSIKTPIVKIGFAFIPLSMVGMMYGPLYGGIAGALCDFIGAILFPIGAYFPGYTLTAALSGATYGWFLQKGGAKSWTKVTVASLIINLVYHLGINTYWTTLFTGKGYLALLPTRIFSNVVLLPMEIIVIMLTYKLLVERIEKAVK